VLAAIALAAPRLRAQAPPSRCSCGIPDPRPGPVPTPHAGDGPGGDPGGGGWLPLLPIAPIGVILRHEARPSLLPAEIVPIVAPRDTEAAVLFRANVDSLGSGMRAPDTATPLPTVVLFAASLGAFGCTLLRRRPA
jgi:hypothetical protein